MAGKKENAQPIRRSVHVDCPIEDAFRLFTEKFGEWWPLASHSLAPEAETCEMEPWVGGRLFERTGAGEEHDWGTVTVWEPSTRITFLWHPGSRANERQRIDVQFRVDAVGTEVILTHYGWEASGVQASARISAIADCFSRFAGEALMVAL